MTLTFGSVSIVFTPSFPWWILASIAGVILLMVLYGLIRRAKGSLLRLAAGVVLLLLLLDPALTIEERKPLTDVAFILIDDSASQKIGERPAVSADLAAKLDAALKNLPDLDVRIVHAGARTNAAGQGGGTRLFSSLAQATSDVPPSRIAGAVIVSDGQIHDVPADTKALGFDAPVHVLLTGHEKEGDRRLKITEAPGFGLVGKTISVTVQADDLSADPHRGSVEMTVRRDGQDLPPVTLTLGTPFKLDLPIDHAGQNVFELSVPAGPQEISLINNSAVLSVNGVRDRLRVLLISGEPHAGERAWRNILKSDPSVDLVHFTILRPPEKQDATPINELSLIPFPVRELFELKLNEFDLVIFDRYGRTLSLPSTYFENLAQYVENGGALFESSAPVTEALYSLYDTPLARVLPGAADGTVYDRGFRPRVTDLGRRHPVTADLPGIGEVGRDPSWGRWFRQIGAQLRGGTVVMSGLDNRPLLVLDRVGKGRVAQLWSDQAWLWSRGIDGGGPQAEMLRRIAHWLMKEPELEEERLAANLTDGQLHITRQSLKQEAGQVTVTDPTGKSSDVALTAAGPGLFKATLPAPTSGLYKISQGDQTVFVSAGMDDPLEYADLRASAEKLQALLDATDGGAFWAADDGVPDVRRVDKDRAAAGSDWIGLRRNGDYAVTGVRQIPLLTFWLALSLALAFLLLAWRREGR